MPAYELTVLVPVRLLVKADDRLKAESEAYQFIEQNFGMWRPAGYPVNLIESTEVKEEQSG